METSGTTSAKSAESTKGVSSERRGGRRDVGGPCRGMITILAARWTRRESARCIRPHPSPFRVNRVADRAALRVPDRVPFESLSRLLFKEASPDNGSLLGAMHSTGAGSKAAVLGAGTWGTALAKVLAEKGDIVSLWARSEDLADHINRDHVNRRYLPEIELPHNVRATHELGRALDAADLVVFVAPSHATREVARLAAPHVPHDAVIVSATKGIENESLMFMDEVLQEELPAPCARHLSFLSGPSFANELARQLPTAVVVASHDPSVCHRVMKRFHTPYLRLYASDDVPGVECGGALKNVIAIAAGAMDGLGYGMNTRAALITRGLAEMARLAMARGALPRTLAGLAGMGDLVLTCTGELSRNRTVGLELGRGRNLGEVLAYLGHVAEGVKTAKSAYHLSMKLSVDMPIMREVYAVLYDDKPLAQAVKDLMARDLGPEF
jgi:glycerol-3-phosphate dehydrogenase (NAD(P)+)